MSEIRSQATPARDELLEYLRDAELPNTYYHQDDGQGTPAIRPATPDEAAEMALEVMEAAGWSKPRTVNAPSEFEALPVGSVVLLTSRRAGHVAWQKQDGDRWCEASDWECSMTSLELWAVNLPATVLFTPGDVG